MLKKLFIIALTSASFALQGCHPVVSQSSNNEIKNSNGEAKIGTPQSPKDEVPKQQKVDFKGVSFTYNPQIFSEVKSEEVAERPLEDETDKPDYVAPQHILFKLKNTEIDREFIIYVFSIEDYRRMYPAISKYDYRGQFDEELKGVRKVLKDENYRVKNQIPFIPFWDVHQTIQAKVKHFSSRNGKGIFYLTQFNQDFANLINNEELEYVFQGITNDGKTYILAEFPVTASILPNSHRDTEFEGYKFPQTYSEYKENEKQYENYLAKVTKRLGELPQKEFDPNLSVFEEIISSLKIEK